MLTYFEFDFFVIQKSLKKVKKYGKHGTGIDKEIRVLNYNSGIQN